MKRQAAVPFRLKRGQDRFTATTVTSVEEVVHGLLRLDGDRVVVQWRLTRRTDRVGTMDMRSDEEREAVREVVVPLEGVAAAAVRPRRWAPWAGPELVLRAADLRAFEEVAGEGGLKLDHPAELVLGLRRADLLAAEEFCAEVVLALAERALESASDERLPGTGRPALPEA